MKKHEILIISILVVMIIGLCYPSTLKAQAPQSISYQAVLRGLNGEPLTDQMVSLRINLYQGSSSGSVVYSEVHHDTTNTVGLVNLAIGTGIVVSGDFQNIDWSIGQYYLEVELDPAGGTAYVPMGTIQMISVPFALFSENVARIQDNPVSPVAPAQDQVLQWDGSQWMPSTISSGSPGWSLTGNSGTDPLVNFIGTMDNQPLKFRVNNVPAGEINQITNNTFIGLQSGGNSTGTNNAAMGREALMSNTDGFANTAIGSQALYSNTTGFNNTAMGREALSSNTGGFDNTAVGSHALNSNATGNYNTAQGDGALYSNTTGSTNTANGFQALFSNISGDGNTASGIAALFSNTTGFNNTASGSAALHSNTSGHDNTASGFTALYSTTGNQNTALGKEAGYTNDTGNGNVFLGYQAGYNETGSNKLYIANSNSNPPLIYGDFSTGKVGIGTITPNEKIEVDGRIRSNLGFNLNGANGLNDTTNQVTAYAFANNKLKYRTLIHSGGILIYTSEESGWVSAVGDYIFPSFICGDSMYDDRDGQSYATVLIDTQCWMAENLNVGTKINSTISGYQQTDNGTIEKYCYSNDEANCNIYGGLYEWPEAMQYITTEGAKGICPFGWHIPTDNEWKILEGTVDSQYPVGDPEWDEIGERGYNAGGNLKEAGTFYWNLPNTGATNASGFTGLPGGTRVNSGVFNSVGSSCTLWSSSPFGSSNAQGRALSYQSAYAYRMGYPRDHGFAVRCIKGCWPQPSQSNAGSDQLNVSGIFTTLAGNTPSNGSGLWTILSGTGCTIVNPTSPTSGFQGIAGNEYTLIWTITTVCGSFEDQVTISFGVTCGATLIDLRDGQSYSTVQIGDQCWMAENLNVGTKINSFQNGFQQTDNGTIEKYCYDNDEANCAIYGGLYEWPEAMQYVTTEGAQGICPAGWHIPTDNEWKILEGTVDSQYPVGDPEWDGTGWRGMDAGGKLKEAGTTHWDSPNTGATNLSGFTALPGGYRSYDDGGFFNLASSDYFWSSSQYDTGLAWFRSLNYGYALVYRDNHFHLDYGFSMRCLKD